MLQFPLVLLGNHRLDLLIETLLLLVDVFPGRHALVRLDTLGHVLGGLLEDHLVRVELSRRLGSA